MRLISNVTRAATPLIVIGVVLFIAYLGLIVHATPLTWQEMDLDRSGLVSLDEILDASSVVARAVTVHGKACTEYRHVKANKVVLTKCAS